MSLRQKIFLGFAALILIGALSGLYVLQHLRDMHGSVEQVFNNSLTTVERACAAWTDFHHTRDHVADVRAMTSPVDSAASLEEFHIRFNHFGRQLAGLRSAALSDAAKASLDIIERTSATWRHRALVLLGEQSVHAIAAPHLMHKHEETISRELDRLVNTTLAEAAGLRSDIIGSIEETKYVSVASVLFSLLLGSALAIGIGFHIARPLQRFQQTMLRIANNDFEVEIADGERRDEIGEMAGALKVFRENAIERSRAESELRANRRRFKDIAALGSDWFWECDADFRFTFLSDSYERISGNTADQVIGKTVEDMMVTLDCD